VRIAIVGAGAMGSIFGARLHDSGHDVLLLDVSAPLVEKINADGVVVERDGERTTRVPAARDASQWGRADAVIFFVKGYHTEAAAELAAPLVGRGTAVASLQNGWGNEEVLAGRFGAGNVVAGVTYNSGTVLGLGHVAHTNEQLTVIGPYAGESVDVARPLEAALRDAGFPVEATPGIVTEVWKKLVLNCATLPTAALSRLTTGALGEPGPMLDLCDDLAREAVAVAHALGLDLDAEERVATINDLLARGGAGKASMLQDVEAGRRTEIDTINGAVVREASRNGVDVPLNGAMVALVKGYERANGLA
jgi:2-dehydropantoate 2-reductase